jgi:phosphotriesterase-related protein
MIVIFREHSLLSRLLLSHDDGWGVEFDNGELVLKPFGNGNKIPYRTISEVLIKKLNALGFTQKQIDMIFIENPKKAFGILN